MPPSVCPGTATFTYQHATKGPCAWAPGSWASVLLRRFVHTTVPASAPHVPTTVPVPPSLPDHTVLAMLCAGVVPFTCRRVRARMSLTVMPRTDLCSIVSPLAQLLALSGQSDCRRSVAFPKRRRRTCIRATLAAAGGLWPCLSMFAPGVEQKESHTPVAWTSHREARPNTIRHQCEHILVPYGGSNRGTPDSPLHRKQTHASERPGEHRENDDARRSRCKQRRVAESR